MKKRQLERPSSQAYVVVARRPPPRREPDEAPVDDGVRGLEAARPLRVREDGALDGREGRLARERGEDPARGERQNDVAAAIRKEAAGDERGRGGGREARRAAAPRDRVAVEQGPEAAARHLARARDVGRKSRGARSPASPRADGGRGVRRSRGAAGRISKDDAESSARARREPRDVALRAGERGASRREVAERDVARLVAPSPERVRHARDRRPPDERPPQQLGDRADERGAADRAEARRQARGETLRRRGVVETRRVRGGVEAPRGRACARGVSTADLLRPPKRRGRPLEGARGGAVGSPASSRRRVGRSLERRRPGCSTRTPRPEITARTSRRSACETQYAWKTSATWAARANRRPPPRSAAPASAANANKTTVKCSVCTGSRPSESARAVASSASAIRATTRPIAPTYGRSRRTNARPPSVRNDAAASSVLHASAAADHLVPRHAAASAALAATAAGCAYLRHVV